MPGVTGPRSRSRGRLCAGTRLKPLAALLCLAAIASCKQLTQEEIIAQFSGVRVLESAGSAPLPFVEQRADEQLEILAGTLNLMTQSTEGPWRRCRLELAVRVSTGAQPAGAHTESSACEYGRLLNTGIFFRLGEGSVHAQRFLNLGDRVQGSVDRDGSIRIVDRHGVEFHFRR